MTLQCNIVSHWQGVTNQFLNEYMHHQTTMSYYGGMFCFSNVILGFYSRYKIWYFLISETLDGIKVIFRGSLFLYVIQYGNIIWYNLKITLATLYNSFPEKVLSHNYDKKFSWWHACQHIEAETNGHCFADNIFKCIFLNENAWISIQISLKFVPWGPINNIPTLVQIMDWQAWPGDKLLCKPMMVNLLTHICVTWPQWVKKKWKSSGPWKFIYGSTTCKMFMQE